MTKYVSPEMKIELFTKTDAIMVSDETPFLSFDDVINGNGF